MHDVLTQTIPPMLGIGLLGILDAIKPYFFIFLGFSAVIFVHELGHFLVAKWAGVRIEKFCVGFGRELFGFTRGETRYGFNLLPLGGYVKMLGQEDFEVDTSGELQHRQDPRSFANKPVGKRMLIVSAGVVMNVLFAAVLFMIVFMIGLQVLVTDVGYVLPNSPAALAGLQAGDKILAIDGRPVREFAEINMAIVLADPHESLEFKVERDGQVKHLKILAENNPEKGVLMVGMAPGLTRTILSAAPGADFTDATVPRFGDQIVEINGHEVTDANANEMYVAMIDDPGKSPRVVVDRPLDPDDPDSPTQRLEVHVRPTLRLHPSDPADSNSVNVLGLTPLMRFDNVDPTGRAALAGLRAGDTVVKIGDVAYPTRTQIAQTIRQWCTVRTGPGKEEYDHAERDIPIDVRRAGEERVRQLVVRPKVRRHLFDRNGLPQIGATYDLIAEDLLQIGAVVPEVCGVPTPAAQAGIPVGSVLRSVNEEEVTTWIELIEALRTRAGETVAIAYVNPDSGGAVAAQTAQMRVPASLRSKMGLPVFSSIKSIDGAETVTVELRGRTRAPSVSHWYGLRAVLAESVGKTVTVKYTRGWLGQLETAQVAITEDMIDPWIGRIAYLPNIDMIQARKTLRTSNPLEAVGIGVRKTAYFILQVYNTMKRMIFTRSVGVEHLAGPVGIVKMGSDFASVGLNQLFFFLAVISANLAVINFLPLPIVDGGLMVFLLIEKIKGTPVSIRTQVVTQVIGLFLIIAAFLFVTYQDLQRLLG
ncbi:MAG TPA: site-2 protease family protein [Phycisphaerae bacterium]|nr:site-2 protease family protein [Phycisphaerae bacterium]